MELTYADNTKLPQLLVHNPNGADFDANGYGDFITTTIGQFVRQDTVKLFKELDLRGANFRMTFAEAFVRNASDFNFGARASTFMLGFEAWVDDYESTRKLAEFQAPPP